MKCFKFPWYSIWQRIAKGSAIAMILLGISAICLGQYSSHGSARKVVKLSEPNSSGQFSFEELLARRRIVGEFKLQSLKTVEIGQLAWAGQGVIEPETGLRTVPSPGGVYPIKLYFAVPDGLFVYNPAEHNLEQTSVRDVRVMLAAAASGNAAPAHAGCDIIIAGSVRKLAAKYGNKARGHLLLEAGRVAQNIQLQAEGLDLGSVPIGTFDKRAVEKACRLPRGLEPVYMICVGYSAQQRETVVGSKGQTNQKSAVLIIASDNFQDEELFWTKLVLDKAGVKTVIASSRKGRVGGMLGSVVKAELSLNDLNVEDYDAVIFVGGTGVREYFGDARALNIARNAAVKGKILAAICIAPTILANAGLLEGATVTGFFTERGRLQNAGAAYTGKPVERDGVIITGRGPADAKQFGQAIADALAGR